jgi:Carboxypeptidase regulatory-like domain/TonB dependent receptor
MKTGVLRSASWKMGGVVFFLTLGLSFLSCAPLFAQGTAGRILGTVTDQSGGSIAGATVIVTDVDRNVPRTLTTGQSGEYDAPSLLPGNYKVRAEAKGFKAFERSGVFLEVNGEIRVNLVMQPGEVSQTITVNESVPLIETTNAELGATLQSAIIEDMPLNGRNFENLLQLNPGVVIYPGGSGMAQSANGQRPHDNVYMVNGIMASDPWMGQSVFNAVMAAGDAGTIMPVDAIDEFKTEENPRAEYGWKPGAIVSVGIKSGTNTIHGSAYAYGRDTAFDARNYFNPNTGTNPTKQPVELEQYGATLGGPIKKDKLFYFANFESQHYAIASPSAISTPQTVPGAGAKTSLIDACNAALTAGKLTALSTSLAGLTPTCGIDSSKTTKDPGGLAFQGLFPVNDGSAGGLIFSDIPSNNTIRGGLGKVDYHANDKNQLEGMYFISEGDNIAVDAPGSQVSTQWLSAQHARSQAISGDWAFTPNSTVVNEVRFGYAHYYQTFFGTDSSQNAANYNFNGQTYEIPTGINPAGQGGTSYGGAPGMRFQGFFGNGATIGIGWPKVVGPDGVLEFLDHVSVLHGKHAFKFGGEIIQNTSTTNETANAKGPIRFGSLTNFFEGTLKRANLFLGDAARTLNAEGYAAFLQDDWRVTPRLTVNLGVRYELNTVVHERNGLMGNFDPILGMVQTNNPYHGDHNNFSPRVGFAWDVRGDGKTVIRAGAGILYEQVSMDVFNGEGNLLGLRTFPTGIPLFNAGSTTAQPLAGNIQLQALAFTTGSALAPINTAWRNFNPALPVAGQTTLYASVQNPACGDGVNNPNPLIFGAAPTPCEIYGVDPNIRTPYVDNWNLDIQRAITNNLSIDIGYVGNHGTKLLGKLDLNQPAPGAGWTAAAKSDCITQSLLANAAACSPDGNAEQAALPFTAPCAAAVGVGANSPGGPFNPSNSCFSYLSYITQIKNIYESNYNGLQITLTGRNYHGLSFTTGYTYSHALGMASDQGTSANFPIPTNSYGNLRQQLYANTDFDIRHRLTISATYKVPGRKGFGQLMEGWTLNSIVLIQSGLPWGLSDASDDFSGTNVIGTTAGTLGEQWNFFGKASDFTPIHGFTDTNGGTGGLPYFGGSGDANAPTANAACNAKAAAIGPLASASLANLGCYAIGSSILIPPGYGSYGTTAQNLWRDGGFKNWDMSVAKLFTIKERLTAEFRVELFNVLNHPDFSNPSGGPGGGIGDPSGGPPFGFSGLTPDTYSSNPQLGSGGARAMQLGLKLSW